MVRKQPKVKRSPWIGVSALLLAVGGLALASSPGVWSLPERTTTTTRSLDPNHAGSPFSSQGDGESGLQTEPSPTIATYLPLVMGAGGPPSSATPTGTATPTETPTPTATSPSATPTVTETHTPGPSPTASSTVTASPTGTATFTATASTTSSPSSTPTQTPTATKTQTPSPTGTPTWTSTPSDTPTASATPTSSQTPTPTGTPAPLPELVNADFELGHTGWVEYSLLFEDLIVGTDLPLTPHSGLWLAWFGGWNLEVGDLSQQITVLPGVPPFYVQFYGQISSDETNCSEITPSDVLIFQVNDTVLETYPLCAAKNTSEWVASGFATDLSAYAGQVITLHFRVETNDTLPSSFFLDDVSLSTQPPGKRARTMAMPVGTTPRRVIRPR